MRVLGHPRSSFFDLQPKDCVTIGDEPYIVEGSTRGGMGCVYFLLKDSDNAPARLSSLGLRLALKAILPDATNDDGAALFKRELTVWSAFRHPSIIWLLEIVDGGDAGWVAAMDWCFGSLRELIVKHGRISLRDSSMILSYLIEGLDYAYQKDKVHHLDLKPENVLYHLDFRGLSGTRGNGENPFEKYRFMLADWGIASIKQRKLNELAGMPSSEEFFGQTLNNIGTCLYMAPERFLTGYSSSIASDVFSLGIMFLEMLTGELPFKRGTDPVEALISGQYLRDAAELLRRNAIPVASGKLILEMIAFSPKDRPSNYSALRHKILRAWGKSNSIFSRAFK